MTKAILPEIGCSRGGESPIRVEAVAALDDKAICFSFGAIFTVKIFEKSEKSSKLLWVLRSFEKFLRLEREFI